MAEYKESLSTPYVAMVAGGGSIPPPSARNHYLQSTLNDIQEDEKPAATSEANNIGHL